MIQTSALRCSCGGQRMFLFFSPILSLPPLPLSVPLCYLRAPQTNPSVKTAVFVTLGNPVSAWFSKLLLFYFLCQNERLDKVFLILSVSKQKLPSRIA